MSNVKVHDIASGMFPQERTFGVLSITVGMRVGKNLVSMYTGIGSVRAIRPPPVRVTVPPKGGEVPTTSTFP